MATSATYGIATYGSSQYGIVFVTGSAGAYTLTGNAASFKYDYNLVASAGAYSLTGGASTLIHNEVIYAGYWQFTWTGNDAGLTADRILTAEAGAYALTGGDAAFLRDYVAIGDAGAYAITGQNATFDYQQLGIQTTGGVAKKVKTKIKKSQRDEVEAIVREAFDKMDGTFVPEPVVTEIQKEVKKEIKQIDLGQYDVAMAQINALLLTAKLKIHEYESELDDEESLLMLL